MIIAEERERTGQIDISNLEIRVDKKKKKKEDIVSETVLCYKNRIIHSPTLCKSSLWEKSTAAQVQTITGASVPLWESDFESVLSGFENRARPPRSHFLSPACVAAVLKAA